MTRRWTRLVTLDAGLFFIEIVISFQIRELRPKMGFWQVTRKLNRNRGDSEMEIVEPTDSAELFCELAAELLNRWFCKCVRCEV